MEISIFVQTPLFGPKAHDPVEEHRALLRDVEYVRQADRYGFKYAWAAEHHTLTEYSHMSASESFIPYVLALTERIHVGSGIWPLNPVTNHPVRLAERAAMIDQLSRGRFELGTGRGAGTHEIGTFNLQGPETRENWDEVVRELKRMWESVDYSHEGRAFSTPARNILPKPFGGGRTHPPMWVAAGNIPTVEKAGRLGLGLLGFAFLTSPAGDVRPVVDAYKKAVADAEPVGRYVNDNFMTTVAGLCLEDRRDVQRYAAGARFGYLFSLLNLYHDTFPKLPGAPVWPNVPPEPVFDPAAPVPDDDRPSLIGTPDQVVAALRAYADAGIDQVGFAMALELPLEVALESIKVMGEKVIPQLDTDPIHRSARMRWGDRAEQMVGNPLPEPFDSAVSRSGSG